MTCSDTNTLYTCHLVGGVKGEEKTGTTLRRRVNGGIKSRTLGVGTFPNDPAITRLVGAGLLEQHEHWQLEGRRMFSAESMAAIPDLEALPALQISIT